MIAGVKLQGIFAKKRWVKTIKCQVKDLDVYYETRGQGKPIIILTELVTGGYTKLATVVSTDLSKVAQLKPGDRVRFTPVSIEEAHQLIKEQEERLRSFKEFFEQR